MERKDHLMIKEDALEIDQRSSQTDQLKQRDLSKIVIKWSLTDRREIDSLKQL